MIVLVIITSVIVACILFPFVFPIAIVNHCFQGKNYLERYIENNNINDFMHFFTELKYKGDVTMVNAIVDDDHLYIIFSDEIDAVLSKADILKYKYIDSTDKEVYTQISFLNESGSEDLIKIKGLDFYNYLDSKFNQNHGA